MKHCVYSQEKEMPIAWFDKFDRQAIKETIINHLTENKRDTVEHCKEYSARDIKRFVGMEIINLYEVNPKSGNPSLIIVKGNTQLYKSLT